MNRVDVIGPTECMDYCSLTRTFNKFGASRLLRPNSFGVNGSALNFSGMSTCQEKLPLANSLYQ